MQEKMPTLKKVMYGTTERYSFSKLETTLLHILHFPSWSTL